MASKERYRRDIEYYKNYRKTHRTEQRRYEVKYEHTHRLASNRKHRLRTKKGNIYALNKRDYTGYCELCGLSPKRLEYHHWDNKNPSKGIWVVHWTHQLCELIDRGIIPLTVCSEIPLVEKYLELREKINAEYALSGIK